MFSNEIIIPENMNRYTQAFILNKECISLFLSNWTISDVLCLYIFIENDCDFLKKFYSIFG